MIKSIYQLAVLAVLARSRPLSIAEFIAAFPPGLGLKPTAQAAQGSFIRLCSLRYIQRGPRKTRPADDDQGFLAWRYSITPAGRAVLAAVHALIDPEQGTTGSDSNQRRRRKR